MKMNGLGISLNTLNEARVEEQYETLNDREQYIIRHLTGYDNHVIKSLNLISEELGISRERTRQIAIIAIGKMDAAVEKDKEEVVEQLLYLSRTNYGGTMPNSFDIKLNHTKLYWKIRGTYGSYKATVDAAQAKLSEE